MSKATVSNFKREIHEQVREGNDLKCIAIPARKRGRPLLLPEEIDQLIKKFVQNLRHSGSPVSSSIVLAAAKGIISQGLFLVGRKMGGQWRLKSPGHFPFYLGMVM